MGFPSGVSKNASFTRSSLLSPQTSPFRCLPLAHSKALTKSRAMSQSTNHAESFPEHQQIERERGFREPRAPTSRGSHMAVCKEVQEEETQLLEWPTRHAGAMTLPPVAQGKGSFVLGYRSRLPKTSLAFHSDLQPLNLSGMTFPSSASSPTPGWLQQPGPRRTSPRVLKQAGTASFRLVLDMPPPG